MNELDGSWLINAWLWAALSGVIFFLVLGWWSRRWADHFSPRVCCAAYGIGMVRLILPLPAPWKFAVPGAGWILAVLAIGAVFRLGLTIYRSRIVYHRIIGLEQLLKERLHGLFLEEKAAAGVHSRPVLICSALPLSPMLIGWLRPLLFLPADWAEKSSDPALRQILRHELEHLRFGDLRMIWGWNLIRSLYWFVPGMGAFERDFRLQREYRCDEAMLVNSPHSAESYAATLLELAGAPAEWSVELRGAAPLAENPSELACRVARLLRSGSKRRPWAAVMSVTVLLAVLTGIGCLQVRLPENAPAVIEKALLRLDPENAIGSRKGFYLAGKVELKIIGASPTERYPKHESSFQRYDDSGYYYCFTAPVTMVSTPRGSWMLAGNNREGIAVSENPPDFLKPSDFLNLTGILASVRSGTVSRDPGNPEKFSLVVQEKPFYKIEFGPDFRVERIIHGRSTWEYDDYRTAAGGYLPMRVTETNKGTLASMQRIYHIEEVRPGFEPGPGWFKKPETIKPSPQRVIGEWRMMEWMSYNQKAMREIYGQELNLCLKIVFRNADGDEIRLNQLTFSSEESAEHYLKNPAADATVAVRWRLGKYVQEMGPMTPAAETLKADIQRREEIFGI